MKIQNYTETMVKEVMEEILKSGKSNVCTCEKCKLDIMAKALNNLPSHYYVTLQGEVYTKLAASYNDFRTKVVTELTKAMMHIEKEPRHQ